MYNNQNRLRNIELPENLFSNLGETKNKSLLPEQEKITPQTAPSLDYNDYLPTPDAKLTNYQDKNEYRNRVSKMYNDLKDISPIDNQIDNILYFNNYIEKGIVIKPKLSSLKQFWTEYRLIKNENENPKYYKNEDNNFTPPTPPTITPIEPQNISSKKSTNFDELFEALSQRVDEINKYIDELKEMKQSIDKTSNQLQEDKNKLKEEKQEFLEFKQSEENKIQKEKESLKINFDRLQTIINDLDKKLNEIEK